MDFADARSLFRDSEYARKELLSARHSFCSKKVTRVQWVQIQKVVGMIFFYACESISKMAHATLLEMTMREPYMERFWRDGKPSQ